MTFDPRTTSIDVANEFRLYQKIKTCIHMELAATYTLSFAAKVCLSLRSPVST